MEKFNERKVEEERKGMWRERGEWDGERRDRGKRGHKKTESKREERGSKRFKQILILKFIFNLRYMEYLTLSI